jgi:pimeloyl-ACP methyl ester carboxylesterase
LPAPLCDAELYSAPLAAVGDLADPLVVTVAEPDLGRAAALVLERAPMRLALVGTSAGGNLALQVLAAGPHRIAGLWLTGVNPGPHADRDGARLMQERVRSGDFEAVLDMLAGRCVQAAGPRADEALGQNREQKSGGP